MSLLVADPDLYRTPRLLGPNGTTLFLDPEVDAPLVGPSVFALMGSGTGNAGCAMWRIWNPFGLLRNRGYPAEWGYNEDVRTVEAMVRFKAIVLCRMSWPPEQQHGARRWFAAARRNGQRVFYEADDDLFSVFMADQQVKGINKNVPKETLLEEAEECAWTLAQCDGVTVSTQRLATTARRYTDKPVEVIPNAIDAEWFLSVQARAVRKVPRETLTIGWAGGNRPDGDLNEMAKAWGAIAGRYPNVRFVVMGHQPYVISRYVPERRLLRLPWMRAEEYPAGLVNFDIGCCPLEDRPFNRCKTAIKAWEYGLSGAAVVASPTVYGMCLRDGENGRVVLTAAEWEQALSELVEHEDQRRAMADSLKRDVLTKWSLRKNLWRWPAAWQRLLEGTHGNG